MSARNNYPITQKQVDRLKQRAKELKKESSISHAEALDAIARDHGYGSWKALLSKKLEGDEQDEFDFIEESSAPVITESLANANKAYLTSLGIECAVFIPTPTGLKKSIIDATAPIRTLFELSGFHFYDIQGQGRQEKLIKAAVLLSSPNGRQVTNISLYRPETKSGDPRMWITALQTIAEPWDEIAIVIFNDTAYLINISRADLYHSHESCDSIGQFLNQYIQSLGLISDELLMKLKLLANSPIPAIGRGDTAIGMAIEAALGILPNSSKSPDYKGIEIKSGRGQKNRTTLFAQVPVWELSSCKSSGEILEKYGYVRGERKKLYCTVGSKKPNSQGLIFSYDAKSDWLHELDGEQGRVAVWTGDVLRKRLKEKHSETFWIDAKSITIDGREHFQLRSVVHTRQPVLAQLMPLIDSGVITMDHLISKGESAVGGVREKGPLFKINKNHLNLLFPAPIVHALNV